MYLLFLTVSEVEYIIAYAVSFVQKCENFNYG